MYGITRIFYYPASERNRRLKKTIRKLVRQRNKLAFRLSQRRGRRRR
jgi:hypothetical protein